MDNPCSFVDLHSHLLPGLDDGAEDWETFLDIARYSVENGVSTMAATSHCDSENLPDKEDYLKTFDQAVSLLKTRGIGLRIEMGSEIAMGPSTGSLIESGDLIPIGHTNYYLVELPFTQLPIYANKALYAIILAGARPILAHPERYAYTDPKSEFFRWAAGNGVLFQINAASIIGKNGGRAKKLAKKMIRKGMAHLVASDCHNAHDRPQTMPRAFKAIEAEFGEAKARELFCLNPGTILINKSVETMEINTGVWRKKFSFWKKY